MQANGAVVSANDLARRYGEGDTAVDALSGVSLEVSRGQLTTVMGPSGSGKSTLMHILAGLDRPTSGSVKIDGTEITTLGDTELTKLRREHIGFIFQFFNLLPMLTAEENVVLPLTIAGEKAGQGVARAADRVGRPEGPAQAPAIRALGRPAAARRHRARARVEADRRVRRRADRQPRLEDRRRDPRAAPPGGAGGGPDDGDGDARPPVGLDRRPDSLPRRRQYRQGAAAVRSRPR